ncbi:MAG: hypothetical protein COA43_09570 [Robiginitomaculum sp.]|nr:MAG: hypothetical protein COA43_09570 [Robiginitomaculum sp.]
MTYLPKHIALTVTLSIIAGLSAPAAANDLALGLSAGTDGVTANIKFGVSNKLSVSAGYGYLKFNHDKTYDGIDYTGDLKLANFQGFINYHPFGGAFNISGGAYLGDKSLDLLATPASDVQIGDVTYTPAQVGTLDGKGELANFAPYAGIGYDNFLSSNSAWSFNARLGVMFSGSPDIELSSSNGLLSADSVFRAELDKEIAKIEDDINTYKYYPVISLGIMRSF